MESYLSAEDKARVEIDKMLEAAGWAVQDAREGNLAASQGVAVREFILEPPHGRADYLLFVDREAVGVIEAKPEGATLIGVEWQSAKYLDGLPDWVTSALEGALPFAYQSTGVETRFTNTLDPEARSRQVFWFHRPETLAAWVRHVHENPLAPTLRHRLSKLPELNAEGLWPAQATAIRNLELSLSENRPRALIQMATGAGKTYTAANVAYRAVKHAGARRVLFLVDRANLGRQTLKEFQAFTTPDDGRKFTELYNVQHLASNVIDPVARVTITTIQRLYSILKGEAELDPELDEHSAYDLLPDEPVPVAYNPRIPIETFDVVVVDECHRSIYGVWRQVLDYFDAFVVGLTATPNKQAFGFFNQNLVMEYTHEQAVADSVNVDFDVYRIRTSISEQGSTIDAGLVTAFRDRQTRRLRWETLDEDVAYGAQALDRAVFFDQCENDPRGGEGGKRIAQVQARPVFGLTFGRTRGATWFETNRPPQGIVWLLDAEIHDERHGAHGSCLRSPSNTAARSTSRNASRGGRGHRQSISTSPRPWSPSASRARFRPRARTPSLSPHGSSSSGSCTRRRTRPRPRKRRHYMRSGPSAHQHPREPRAWKQPAWQRLLPPSTARACSRLSEAVLP